MKLFQRNVILLALCQSLMMSGTSLIITTAALVGLTLAPDKALSTLPVAALFVAIMCTSIPAALLMDRIGRKQGFLLSTLFGISGAFMATLAIIRGEFWLFVTGTVLIGIFNGFGNYYRFAAADSVDKAHKSGAVSFVLAGGIVAALLGPNLAKWTHHSFDLPAFAGSYAALAGLYLVALLVMLFMKLPPQVNEEVLEGSDAADVRPLWMIMKQPKFIVALIAGMLGYGVMNLIMTATPIAMHQHQLTFADTAFVIQWHVLGMFAPSLFTGYLINHFGVRVIMFTGGLMGLACVAINLSGSSIIHYWLALVLLGISWNFLFIGATVLLTETYHPQERAKAQATNDFVVFTTVAIASLSAGALQSHFGWKAVNLGVVPLLIIILISLASLGYFSRKYKVNYTVSPVFK